MRYPGPSFDLRAALSTEIRAALNELDAAHADPKALHRCRVRIKRARALAHVGHACAPGLSGVFNGSARAVMHLLSATRDAHALASAARAIACKAGKAAARALNVVADRLDAAHASAPPPNFAAARAGLTDLLALAQVWPEAAPQQIKRGAARIVRRARKARAAGRKSEDAGRRHVWRRREKDRFYAVLLLGQAWPSGYKRRRRTGEKLGETLGHERDTLLLIERIGAEEALFTEPKAIRAAQRLLSRRRVKLAKRADALGDKLHAGGA